MNEEWRNELVTKGAVFDAQEVYMAIRPLDGYEDGLAMLDILRNLPSAQPVRKTGQWIKRKKGAIGYNCSCCGKSDISNHFDYCPNCGADMRGEQDGKNT